MMLSFFQTYMCEVSIITPTPLLSQLIQGLSRIAVTVSGFAFGEGALVRVATARTRWTLMWSPTRFASHIRVLNREVPFILNIILNITILWHLLV